MSPLVVLGLSGTVVSTVSMLPHLVHAVRNRRPAGSSFAWLFGAVSSGIWLVYGLVSGDLLVAAPGFVTVPAGVVLGVWCVLHARGARPVLALVPPVAPAGVVAAGVRRVDVADLYAEEIAGLDRVLVAAGCGDTLELPRIAA